MKAIIAEDELVARQCIAAMANAFGIEVLAECKDGEETIASLNRYRADLLFLDVQMPGIDGFGVLQGMPHESIPAIIFTTAYDQYAVRAFEHQAVDYLLKPFDEERLRKAVDRVRVQLANRCNRGDLIGQLLREINKTRQVPNRPQRLVVRSRGQVTFLRVDEIDWIEASHNHVKVHIGRDAHFLRQTIAEVEARLHPDKFLRIHRSMIVNVDRILRLESCGYGEYLVVLHDGKKLSLSRGCRDRLDRFIGGLLESHDSSPTVSGTMPHSTW
jgi:two-component system LytT family response regulator